MIDQVVGRTTQLVLVSRIREPLTTAREIVLLLPPGIDRNAGFHEAIHTIKTLADRSGVRVRGIVVWDDPEDYARTIARIGPAIDADFEGVSDWKALLAVLRDDVSPTDLVVCTNARRGTRGWHPQLGTLPKSISTLHQGDFLVVYPATAERADDRQFLRLR